VRARRLLAAAALAVAVAGSLSAARPAAAAFPGGNGLIAYTCLNNTGYHICTVNEDGSFPLQLTNGGDDHSPAWSADGSRLAFDCGTGVCVTDANGSTRTQLTDFGYFPAWSPDGSRIAFGCGGICVMNADGSGRAQLTGGADDFPSWSPDGTKIAFERANVSFQGRDIYVVNADGSGETALTNSGDDVLNLTPDWSPDGTRIVFASTRGGYGGQVYTMDADGSNVTQLTSGTNDVALDPAWSPDGTKIVYDGGQVAPVTLTELHVMNADGSDVVDLHDDYADAPDWQPLTGTPRPFSDLALRMAGPRRIGPGDPITYVIRVRNTGPAEAEDVTVTDPIPAGTAFVRVHSSRGSCSAPDPGSGAALTCSLGSMGDGSVRTIIVVCRALRDGATTITNTATVAGGAPDPDLHDNSATVRTEVR
jgi:TolB protein